jgi:hypothetical protein
MSVATLKSFEEFCKLEDTDVTSLIMEKLGKHLPCLIRFNRKAQDVDTPGYEDHTGILFGCHCVSGNFEFGIYFKDPISTDKDMKHIELIPANKRQYKVFAGASFIMTCYYHWDSRGTLSNTTPYTRTFYEGAEIQLNPNSPNTWVKMQKCFPKDVRNRTNNLDVFNFLTGKMDDDLPVANASLITKLDPTKCHPTQFNALSGRRNLMGRGGPSKKTLNKTDKKEPSTKRKRIPNLEKKPNQHPQKRCRKPKQHKPSISEEDEEEENLSPPLTNQIMPQLLTQIPVKPTPSCPGCDCHLTDKIEWGFDPSSSCCGIKVCKTCAEMRAYEWNSNTMQSCFGSWITKQYCNKYMQKHKILIFSDLYETEEMNPTPMRTMDDAQDGLFVQGDLFAQGDLITQDNDFITQDTTSDFLLNDLKIPETAPYDTITQYKDQQMNTNTMPLELPNLDLPNLDQQPMMDLPSYSTQPFLQFDCMQTQDEWIH